MQDYQNKPPNIANKACQDSLKTWEAKVARGEVQQLVIIGADNFVYAGFEIVGDSQYSYATNWAMDDAKRALHDQMRSRHMNMPATKGDSDRICYNISEGPACFDFYAWMQMAHQRMLKAGHPGPLKVGFVMTEGPEEAMKHKHLRENFYKHVIFPSVQMFGAVIDQESNNAETINYWTLRPVVEEYRKGLPIAYLKAPPQVTENVRASLAGRFPITITMREAPYNPERNSNVPEWILVAEWLRDRGQDVIFVRDTCKFDHPIEGFDTFPEASKDIQVRTALYAQSKLNLFVSNGPWSVALFQQQPWLMFVELDEKSQFWAESISFWAKWHGIDKTKGEQFPWCTSDQRIIWQRDNSDSIIDAIKALPCMEGIDDRQRKPRRLKNDRKR